MAPVDSTILGLSPKMKAYFIADWKAKRGCNGYKKENSEEEGKKEL